MGTGGPLGIRGVTVPGQEQVLPHLPQPKGCLREKETLAATPFRGLGPLSLPGVSTPTLGGQEAVGLGLAEYTSPAWHWGGQEVASILLFGVGEPPW